eukprot:gnl/Chilomastix_cuspidata/7834.p5 GENE.gnl/Chilomastix_cuspidata/7834~~gnl/Chilomastix_cuspidata/7834.p5  ORF type:complete len:103 (-),score=0.27 gnl/Chilomastix_cuspidata/7834:377-685(-)
MFGYDAPDTRCAAKQARPPPSHSRSHGPARGEALRPPRHLPQHCRLPQTLLAPRAPALGRRADGPADSKGQRPAGPLYPRAQALMQQHHNIFQSHWGWKRKI